MLMRKNTYLIFLFTITFFNTLLVLAQDVLPTNEKIYTPNQIEMIKDQRDMVKKIEKRSGIHYPKNKDPCLKTVNFRLRKGN